MINKMKNNEDIFWALKDVNFEVKQGESVGIIGRNGAGKSTLFKILSQITPPTTGKITMYGRVASLLEVGTGFHQELTGRENIFLNGAILGLSHSEIRRKFDEIVAFSEVEKFLDMPVKHYSSGMYMRLAFAVAAHLESEISIVDEVLAVGDAQFQKKCLGKMDEVAKKEGRTVLFVSHNMSVVRDLCKKSILMDHGHLIKYGATKDVINHYLGIGIENESKVNLLNHVNRVGGMHKVLKSVELLNDNLLTTRFSQLDNLNLTMGYKNTSGYPLSGCGFIIYSDSGIRVGGEYLYEFSATLFVT